MRTRGINYYALPVSIPLILIGISLILVSLTGLVEEKSRVAVPIRVGGRVEMTEMETGSPGVLLLLIPGLSFATLGVWLIIGKSKTRKQQRLAILGLGGKPWLAAGKNASRESED